MSKNKKIPVDVTYFFRPNGRQVLDVHYVSESCQAKYDEIIKLGGRLTFEDLTTGHVSQTIEFASFDFDIAIEPGGLRRSHHTGVFETMILRFDEETYRKQLAETRR